MDYPVRTPAQMQALIKAFRTKAGFTQTSLSKRLGITQQALSRLERDPQKASIDRLLPLLSALGVSLVLRDQESAGPRGEW